MNLKEIITVARLLLMVQKASRELRPPNTRDIPYKGDWVAIKRAARELQTELGWDDIDIQKLGGERL